MVGSGSCQDGIRSSQVLQRRLSIPSFWVGLAGLGCGVGLWGWAGWLGWGWGLGRTPGLGRLGWRSWAVGWHGSCRLDSELHYSRSISLLSTCDVRFSHKCALKRTSPTCGSDVNPSSCSRMLDSAFCPNPNPFYSCSWFRVAHTGPGREDELPGPEHVPG